MLLATVLAVLLATSSVDAAIPNVLWRMRPHVPLIPFTESYTPVSRNRTVLPPLNTIYYFDQLIDHNNPSLGTFQQRYWMNYEFYEDGGPIILMTPGEAPASRYRTFLTNQTINGLIAQQQKGATIIIEHRFFGESNPYDNLTSQSLEVLTIQQAIDDLVYFAQNVHLPMPYGNDVKPDTTPWVLVGGSYSGALVGWTMVNRPGIFHAGYASSAVVEAMTNFYDYFKPIREHMPQNCSSDVQAVVAYLDQIYAENNTTAIQDMKNAFGLGHLAHVDDFAYALTLNPYDWQLLQPWSNFPRLFYHFCDQLEVKDGVSAPTSGWGVEHAIQAWGTFWRDSYYTYACGTVNVETCLGTYNASESTWRQITVNNPARSWFWMVCNQVGWYQGAPPPGQRSLVSRIMRPAYFERFCVNFFPEKFSSPPTPSVDDVNRVYGGWNASVDRLFFATGVRDPWRGVTVSADGLKKANTTMQPIYESDGFHGSDLSIRNGLVDETVHAVQSAALEYMAKWLA